MSPEHNIDADLPRVILHNTISLDGSLKGFEADLNIHYSIATSLQVDAYLVGSQTILDASDEIPPEPEEPDQRPTYDSTDIRPFWVLVDSQSRLKGLLHYYRRMDFIKDLIVLISHRTPKDYQEYLKKHDYPFIRAGKDKVDFREAFREIRKQFHIETMLTDSGPTLNNELLRQSLVDEISLLVAPMILAQSQPKIFVGLDLESREIRLQAMDPRNLGSDYIWLHYKVKK